MIQTEFRIGNYVRDKLTGEWMRICDLSDSGDFAASVINRDKVPLPAGWQMEPIPLSPALLERCGFVNDLSEDSPNFRLTAKWVNTWKWSIDERIFTSDFVVYANFELGEVRHRDTVVKSLHALQNLFYALTNTDLTIDLNG